MWARGPARDRGRRRSGHRPGAQGGRTGAVAARGRGFHRPGARRGERATYRGTSGRSGGQGRAMDGLGRRRRVGLRHDEASERQGRGSSGGRSAGPGAGRAAVVHRPGARRGERAAYRGTSGRSGGQGRAMDGLGRRRRVGLRHDEASERQGRGSSGGRSAGPGAGRAAVVRL